PTDLNLNASVGVPGEYNACPADLLLNHFAEGSTDSGTGFTVHTELTLIPCTQDILHLSQRHCRAGANAGAACLVDAPDCCDAVGQNCGQCIFGPHAVVDFDSTDEMESHLSVDAVPVDCVLNRRLSDIDAVVFSAGSGVFRKTRITPSPSKLCLT